MWIRKKLLDVFTMKKVFGDMKSGETYGKGLRYSKSLKVIILSKHG